MQTNNATYMGTGQVEQQFAISRLRALETGRYVAVAATNGISGDRRPDGDVVTRAPTRTEEVLTATVPAPDGPDSGGAVRSCHRAGAGRLGLLALAWSFVPGRRSAQRKRSPSSAPTTRGALRLWSRTAGDV